MELIVMILVPFPLGFFIRNRLVPYVAYIAVQTFVFTFQSVQLVIEWVDGSEAAFGPFPKADSSAVWGYGSVNLVIYAVGFGLLYAGQRLGARRRARRVEAVNLDPIT